MFQASFSVRVSKTAEILGVSPDAVLKVLEEEGLKDDPTSLSVLDSSTTSIDDLVDILRRVNNTTDAPSVVISTLKLKAASSFLKGDGFSERPKSEASTVGTDLPVFKGDVASNNSFVEAMKTLRPIQQWNDRELLEKYAADRDPEIEQELHSRSHGRNFVVLRGKTEDGKELIDVENSLDLLKLARKRVTPSFLPLGADGAVSPIYPILSLNMQDRVMELCPICGDSLFRGYCETCNESFSTEFTGMGDDVRAYVHLIARSGKFNPKSHADRKAVIASASKGLDDLKKTWPSIIQQFEELKLTNSLPKLRIIKSRPETIKDPFFQDGNRSFAGNKSF